MTRKLMLAAVAVLALSSGMAKAAPSKAVVAAVADAGRPRPIPSATPTASLPRC